MRGHSGRRYATLSPYPSDDTNSDDFGGHGGGHGHGSGHGHGHGGGWGYGPGWWGYGPDDFCMIDDSCFGGIASWRNWEDCTSPVEFGVEYTQYVKENQGKLSQLMPKKMNLDAPTITATQFSSWVKQNGLNGYDVMAIYPELNWNITKGSGKPPTAWLPGMTEDAKKKMAQAIIAMKGKDLGVATYNGINFNVADGTLSVSSPYKFGSLSATMILRPPPDTDGQKILDFWKNSGGDIIELYPEFGWHKESGTGFMVGDYAGVHWWKRSDDGSVHYYWHHDGTNFVNNAVSACGHVVGSAVNMVNDASGVIGKGLASIPVVGGPLHDVWDATSKIYGSPFQAASEIIQGKSIDKAVLDGFQQTMYGIKEEGPYIESVIAFIPAVGPVASGAIAGGIAIASGESVDDVLVDAAAGAIPGGAFVKAAYKFGKTAMAGGDLTSASLDAMGALSDAAGVPVPDSAKEAIKAGVQLTQQIASGKKVDDALITVAIDHLPDPKMKTAANAARSIAGGKNVADVLIDSGVELVPNLGPVKTKDLKNALGTGMAMGHAQKVQSIIKQHLSDPSTQKKIAAKGDILATKDLTISSNRQLLNGSGVYGFNLAIGLSLFGVTKFQLVTIRKGLLGPDKKGYDMGLSLHIGRVTSKAPAGLNASAQAGYYMTKGMRGAKAGQKASMMKVIAANPDARRGAAIAIKEVAHARQTLWTRVKQWLGFGTSPTKTATTKIHGELNIQHMPNGDVVITHKKDTVHGDEVHTQAQGHMNPEGQGADTDWNWPDLEQRRVLDRLSPR